MFRNILVCADGSKQSEGALREAIDLAAAERARLTLLTAVSRPPSWANTSITAAAMRPLEADLLREAQMTLRAAVDRVPASIPVTSILSEDPIREALIEQLRRDCYDLVVLGTRGRGALSAAVLGSVSHYAVNHCTVPVLVVRSEPAPEPDPRPRPADEDAVAPLVSAAA